MTRHSSTTEHIILPIYPTHISNIVKGPLRSGRLSSSWLTFAEQKIPVTYLARTSFAPFLPVHLVDPFTL